MTTAAPELRIGCAWPVAPDGCDTAAAYRVADKMGNAFRVCVPHLPDLIGRLSQGGPVTVERLARPGAAP
jgi:hypothetical protein